MLKQGAVRVNEERVNDANQQFFPGDNPLIQVGKRRIARATVLKGGGGDA
jgi:tyrosyl-tRNA synthetase